MQDAGSTSSPDAGPVPALTDAPDDPGQLAAFAKAQGAAAIPAIATKLSSKELGLRRAAIEALGRIGGPRARAALQKQLDAETHPELRAAIERAMAEASP
jgi:HEAT repeat protein